MLIKLKKVIQKEGIVQVTADLGYRSPNTLVHWVNKKTIPKIAQNKVKIYLSQKGY